MKVGYVLRSLEDSGVTVYVLRLADAMRRRGHDVFLVSDDGHYEAEVERLGLRRHALPLCRGAATSYMAARRLAETIAPEQPDILHASWRRAQLACHLTEQKTGTPFVSTLHLVGIPDSWLYRRMTYWGRRVIAPCSEAVGYLRDKFGVAEERIRLIFHGVDPGEWPVPTPDQRRDARRQFGLGEDEPVAVCVGRLEAIKGYDVLLQALAEARRRCPQLRLLAAGEGAERAALEGLAGNLGLADAVQFLGYTKPWPAMAAADLFVLASQRESFGFAPVEAMLCGLPVIRTATEGARDQIVEGETGRIVPIGDAEALAGAMADLGTDRDLCGRMGAAGAERARGEFTLDRMAERVETVYNEVLAGGSASGQGAGHQALSRQASTGTDEATPSDQTVRD